MDNLGKVYLIGAGPGDPGLLTLRAHAILQKADVVVYDRLVSPAILGMCNPSAKMVDVGKMPTHHKVKQSEINKLLVKFACEMKGATIARLKGGDPFVFGRGGEEALELVAAGIEFEVVPGVTSAIAVPAYAGIPVSHRGIATSFHIITGHEKLDERTLAGSLQTKDERGESRASMFTCLHDRADRSCTECKDERGESRENKFTSVISPSEHNDETCCHSGGSEATDRIKDECHSGAEGDRIQSNLSLDFESLARCPGTLIFLMGIGNMDFIAHRLIECGKDPKTPLAFIEKGTTPFQRTVMATLETAGETIVREHVTAPAITIMGGVVELGKSLAWKKNLPLSGKRLVVTRAAKQSSGIASRLTALGAEVIETPMIETRTLDCPLVVCHPERSIEDAKSKDLDVNCIADFNTLANFDVLAFTSTNGVESFFKQLFAAGYDVRVLAGKKIASVGKITEKKLLEYGIRCDYVPEDHTGEGLGKLLASLIPQSTEGATSYPIPDESRILLLQGNLADDTLLKLLPKATRWIVYETLPVAELPEWKREAIASADAIVFASSSAVENFVKLISNVTARHSERSEESSDSLDTSFAELTQDDNGRLSRLSFRLVSLPNYAFCIGRMTEASARKHGFETITSDETTMDSLVKKIVEYYTVKKQ